MKLFYSIFIFYFCVIQNNAIGQQSAPIVLRATYKVTYTRDGKSLINDLCQLDITHGQSYFYSKIKVDQLKHIQEKFARGGQNGGPVNFAKGEIRTDICNFSILKNYEKKTAFFIEDVGGQELGYIKDSLSPKRWNISKETTSIKGMICHKATMIRDTILITAWFNTEIPSQEGPLYFYGLPGLIVKATTSAGFDIIIDSIEKSPKKGETLNVSKYSLITETQFNKAKINNKAAFSGGRLPNGDIAKPIGN